MARKGKIEIPPIRFMPTADSEEEQNAILESITPSPGFPTVANMVADVITKRSEVTVFDFTPQKVNIRYQIDNIWHAMPQMDRETGDYMMATLKQLAGMNYRERRARQKGEFKTEFMNEKHKCRIVSQGVKHGERIAMYVDIPKPKTDLLEQLGMPEQVKDSLAPILSQSQGMVFFTAMPKEGYTTAWRAGLSACDRFGRDYYVIEDERKVEEEVINVTSVTFDSTSGEDAFTPIPQLMLREPEVLAFTEIVDGKMLDKMSDMSSDGLLILSRLYAKHALDALLRLLVLKPTEIERLVTELSMVVSMRLLRKVCDVCSIGYVPHPSMLQQLGLPPGSVRQMKKAFHHKPGMVDEDGKEIEVCPNCHGLGYKHITGIFEVLKMTDQLREAMMKKPRLDHLAAVAKANRHVSIRDMGVVAVAKGVTAMDEVQRMLKK